MRKNLSCQKCVGVAHLHLLFLLLYILTCILSKVYIPACLILALYNHKLLHHLFSSIAFNVCRAGFYHCKIIPPKPFFMFFVCQMFCQNVIFVTLKVIELLKNTRLVFTIFIKSSNFKFYLKPRQYEVIREKHLKSKQCFLLDVTSVTY